MHHSFNDAQFLEQLQLRYNSGEMLSFTHFWDHLSPTREITPACFSQWYYSPFEIDGIQYLTAEHFMMAEKARLFEDAELLNQILKTPDPSRAKTLGRKIRGYDDGIWQAHRFNIVVLANTAKFTQHSKLELFLKNTSHQIIVQASPIDSIWGIGLAQNDLRANNPNQWRGLNLLGFALMQVRDADIQHS